MFYFYSSYHYIYIPSGNFRLNSWSVEERENNILWKFMYIKWLKRTDSSCRDLSESGPAHKRLRNEYKTESSSEYTSSENKS